MRKDGPPEDCFICCCSCQQTAPEHLPQHSLGHPRTWTWGLGGTAATQHRPDVGTPWVRAHWGDAISLLTSSSLTCCMMTLCSSASMPKACVDSRAGKDAALITVAGEQPRASLHSPGASYSSRGEERSKEPTGGLATS